MDKDFKKKLYKETSKYVHTFARAFINEASRLLVKEAEYEIARFYNEYTPKVYDRTYDLRDNSYKPYRKNNGRIMYGGVRITSRDMSIYQPFSADGGTDPFEVASFAYDGWHGHPSRGIYSSPAMLDHLRKVKDSVLFRQQIYNTALKEAQSLNYEILKFR